MKFLDIIDEVDAVRKIIIDIASEIDNSYGKREIVRQIIATLEDGEYLSTRPESQEVIETAHSALIDVYRALM